MAGLRLGGGDKDYEASCEAHQMQNSVAHGSSGVYVTIQLPSYTWRAGHMAHLEVVLR